MLVRQLAEYSFVLFELLFLINTKIPKTPLLEPGITDVFLSKNSMVILGYTKFKAILKTGLTDKKFNSKSNGV